MLKLAHILNKLNIYMKESPYASKTLSSILTAATKAGNNLEEQQAHLENASEVISKTESEVGRHQREYEALVAVQQIMTDVRRAFSEKKIKTRIESLNKLVPLQVQSIADLVAQNKALDTVIENRDKSLPVQSQQIEQSIQGALGEHKNQQITDIQHEIYDTLMGTLVTSKPSIKNFKKTLRDNINQALITILKEQKFTTTAINEVRDKIAPVIDAYLGEKNDFIEANKNLADFIKTEIFDDASDYRDILYGLFPFKEGMHDFLKNYEKYYQESKNQEKDKEQNAKNAQILHNKKTEKDVLHEDKRILLESLSGLPFFKGIWRQIRNTVTIDDIPAETKQIIDGAEQDLTDLKLALQKSVSNLNEDIDALHIIENFKLKADQINDLIANKRNILNNSQQELNQTKAKSEQHEKNINKQESELKELHTVKEKRIDDIFSELVIIKNNLLILAESPTVIDIKPELIPALSTDEVHVLRKNNPFYQDLDEQALRLSFAQNKRAKLNEEIREEIVALDKLFLENPPSNQTLTDICSGINSIFTQITVKAEETIAKNLTDSENVDVKDDINVLISGGPKNTYDQIIPELTKYWKNEQTRNKALLKNITAKEAEEANPYLFNHFNLTEGARFKTDEERKKLSASKKTDNRFERLFDISKQAIFTPFQTNLLKAVTNIDAPLDLAYLSELKKDDQKFTYLIDQLEKLVKKQEDKKNQFTEAIAATKNELAKLNEAIEKTQQLIDKPPIGAKIKDLKDYQKALKARKEIIDAHQKEQETLKNDFNTALHKLTDSPINPDAPDNNLIKLLKSLKSGAKVAQRLSAPDDVYVVAVVPGNDSSHKEALKLLRENASDTQNVPFMVVDRNDPNAQRALAVEEQDYNKLDSYRLVDTVPAAAQNKGYTEFQLYFKTASNHQTYLNKLDQEKDKSKLPEPEPDEMPTRIKVCEPNTQFSKLHTKGENFPILANFTSKAEYQKALAHAALQMATRDLQGRVGDNLQSAAAIAKLKKLALTLFAPSQEHAIALYTAYARILEQKCNIPRKEVMNMLAVTEPTKKFTPKGDVYGPFGGYNCKGFDDKALCKFYEIKPQPSEEISKEKKQALQDLIKPQPDQANENDNQQRPRLGRTH